MTIIIFKRETRKHRAGGRKRVKLKKMQKKGHTKEAGKPAII